MWGEWGVCGCVRCARSVTQARVAGSNEGAAAEVDAHTERNHAAPTARLCASPARASSSRPLAVATHTFTPSHHAAPRPGRHPDPGDPGKGGGERGAGDGMRPARRPRRRFSVPVAFSPSSSLTPSHINRPTAWRDRLRLPPLGHTRRSRYVGRECGVRASEAENRAAYRGRCRSLAPLLVLVLALTRLPFHAFSRR